MNLIKLVLPKNHGLFCACPKCNAYWKAQEDGVILESAHEYDYQHEAEQAQCFETPTGEGNG